MPPPQDLRPTVSVVLPVHRDGAAFRAALDAVLELDPPPAEVVVAVDGPDDALAAVAQSAGARVVQLQRQSGPAVARNAGAAAARGDVLYFVDADVVVQPGVVGCIVDHFERHPEVSALIGTYDDDPAEQNFCSQYKNLLNHYVHQHAHVEGTTFWGACGAVRRSVFEAVGGFNPRYPRPTVEDIELGYRIKAAGGRIHVVKELQVKHLKRWTARGLLVSDVRDRALPWSALILRTGLMPDDLNTDHRQRACVLLAALAAASLLAAVWWPWAALAAVAAVTVILLLDRPVLRFFTAHRGAGFAARSAAWHVLYHFYSGLSFAVALVHHLTGSPVYRWRAWRRRQEKERVRRAGAASPYGDRAGTGVPRQLSKAGAGDSVEVRHL